MNRVPAFAKYIAVTDIFSLTDSPRDLAIRQTLKLAVERWIADDFDQVLHLANLAEKYLSTPNTLFEETYA